MEKKNKIPFPQANDFEKVIMILNINNEANLKKKSVISMILGDVEYRQVQYYVSALIYLGLATKEKTFSEKGKYIRTLGYSEQIIELAKLIVSKDVFGTAYFTEQFLKIKLDVDDVVQIMKIYVDFDSNSTYKRRAQTVISWLEWINNKKKDL
ncbi:MAG: DUF7226 domain-containing protein [Bacilli bacterium]